MGNPARESKFRNALGPAVERGGTRIAHNCHFSPNTLEVLRLHSVLTDSHGISSLVRTVMEFYLSRAIDRDDPRYAHLEPVVPVERYRGQHEKLGLT